MKETKHNVENLKCNHCGYKWVGKIKGRLPKSCPLCKQYGKIEEIKKQK